MKYWQLQRTESSSLINRNYHEEYTQLFQDAIKLRYRSDVPVALLLSGGLDSSAIAKVTDNLIESGQIEQNKVQAFIASFPGYEFDETQIARDFISTCKHVELNEIIISPDIMGDELEKIIYGFDHPVASFTSVAHHSIMRECHARGIKVVLNGQGSDEAFAGYDRYIAGIHLLDQLLSFDGRFTNELYYLCRKNGYSLSFLAGQIIKGIINPALASYLRAKFQEQSLLGLKQEFINSHSRNYKPHYKFSITGNNLDRYLLSQINFQGLNQILHYEDVSSMQQSIEIRSPFLDYRLMEFAFSIPDKLKLNKGVTKVIQRESIGKHLPDKIVGNRAKIGFRTPFNECFLQNGALGDYVQDLLNNKNFQQRKIWDGNKLKYIFDHAKQFPQFPFWRFINLEMWANQYSITNL